MSIKFRQTGPGSATTKFNTFKPQFLHLKIYIYMYFKELNSYIEHTE